MTILANHYVRQISLKRDKVSSFTKYPFSIPAVRHLTEIELHPKVTFFIGENGSGKSTVLEAIAIASGMNAEGGGRNLRFDTRASHSDLHEYLRLVRGVKLPRDTFFLRAESFYNVATKIEEVDPSLIDAYGGISLHEQSHGESFLAVLMERFFGQGLYILDEPEAALSPTRQLAVLSRMHDLVNKHSQFIVATHSPILMAYPDAIIYEFSGDCIRRVNYRDTEHYRVTRDFLLRTDEMLNILLESDPEERDS